MCNTHGITEATTKRLGSAVNYWSEVHHRVYSVANKVPMTINNSV
jgi:hypothetical protein